MRILFRSMVSILSASAAGMGGGACAEIPDMRPEKLQAASSHIVTGKVARIYSMVDRSDPQWETTHSVAEIQIKQVEKGRHEGPLAYVRFWNKRYSGKGSPPPGSYGHRRVPEAGAMTRVFVVSGEDGGLDVLPPNGFSPLTASDKKK